MIDATAAKYARRQLFLAVFFGSLGLALVWLPCRLAAWVYPAHVPIVWAAHTPGGLLVVNLLAPWVYVRGHQWGCG